MNRVVIIGIPSSAGARQVGQDKAPQSFRNAGLLNSLRSAGFDVHDSGDLTHVLFKPDVENPRQQNLALVCDTIQRVSERVASVSADHAKLIALGGDCTVTLGVVGGLMAHAPNLGLIYFDGDLDLNTPDTTVSGIFDGMVMSHLIGNGAEPLAQIGPRYPLIAEQNIVLFGYNVDAGSIDLIETERLAELSMAKYPAPKIRENVENAAIAALTQLESQVDDLLIHFDVDVIDYRDFPAADVPHPNGLSFDEAMVALRIFASSSKFAGLVITEFNSDRDKDGSLARRLIGALVRIFGDAQKCWGDTLVMHQ
jgi:arginase